MNIKEKIVKRLQEIVKKITDKEVKVEVSIPKDISNGDYTSNICMQIFSSVKGKALSVKVESPLELAQYVVQEFGNYSGIEKAEAAAPGFINFYLSEDIFQKYLVSAISSEASHLVLSNTLKGKKILVEYAHPNTHKEMHIGHMRTLITGEALSRILESQGAKVFRANYQGDIGPHVAKALYGIEVIMQEKGLTLDDVEEWGDREKAHFLGQSYVRGNVDYEANKDLIDEINTKLYKKMAGRYWDLYQKTRQWSLDYYDAFYKRFHTTFDRLFMESEMYEKGKQMVEEHVGKIFVKDTDGSIIFPGETYGLHTRVFVTQAGNPTYEGKEMQNAFAEWEAFHFDKKIHVVASEQAGYFQVVFKALELLDPEKFKDKQYHLSMGMVQLVGRKMSSRTGDVLTVDWLIDEVKGLANTLFKEGKVVGEERDEALEKVTIGAVKYSVLKTGTAQNAVFDMEKSVSLDGNSGPYIQYTYARTQSILGKAQEMSNAKYPISNAKLSSNYTPQSEELQILRKLYQFPGVIEEAAQKYAPNMICEYLFELSQMFNNFYQKFRILTPSSPDKIGVESGQNAEDSTSEVEGPNTSEVIREFRLVLTEGVGIILKQGLYLLGIEAPEKM